MQIPLNIVWQPIKLAINHPLEWTTYAHALLVGFLIDNRYKYIYIYIYRVRMDQRIIIYIQKVLSYDVLDKRDILTLWEHQISIYFRWHFSFIFKTEIFIQLSVFQFEWWMMRLVVYIYIHMMRAIHLRIYRQTVFFFS